MDDFVEDFDSFDQCLSKLAEYSEIERKKDYFPYEIDEFWEKHTAFVFDSETKDEYEVTLKTIEHLLKK